MTRTQVASRLLRLLRPLAPLMSVSASARVVNQGLGVAIPGVAAALVVGLASGSDIWAVSALLATMAVVKGIFRYVEQFTGHAVAFRLLAEMRVDTFREIVPLAPAGLEDERTGDLVSRVVGDIDRVEPFYAHTIAPLASGIVVPLLAALGLAVWVDPLVAAVFIPFPLLIVVAVPWIRAGTAAGRHARAREQGGETAAVLTDAVQGARELAVFDAVDTVDRRIEDLSERGAETRRGLARIASLRSGLGDLLAGGAVVAVTAVAVGRLAQGQIGPGALAAAVVVAWVATNPARALEDIVAGLEEALAAARRLFDLSDRPPPVTFPPSTRTVPERASVAFSDVTVGFPTSASPALSGVDLTIEEGSHAAIVGPSGSGKSTLVELLVRFRDPDRGTVRIGGVDITELGASLLRREVMLVPQRPEIFYGTIAENLLLADPDAGHEALWEALHRASLGEWARSLERGLDTAIGELGDTMSGGQRQRLALARAFLRDPRILILDEATSELDTDAEQAVLAEIASERGDRTVIVIAHRIESVTDADDIIVLDRGRLVERGRHEALVAAEGVYAGLWRRHLDVVEIG